MQYIYKINELFYYLSFIIICLIIRNYNFFFTFNNKFVSFKRINLYAKNIRSISQHMRCISVYFFQYP